MADANGSFYESRIKQAKRDTIIGYLEGSFPDPEDPIRAFTLPGPLAFGNPNSVERWVISRNPNNLLWCTDKRREVFQECIPIKHRAGRSPADTLEVFTKTSRALPLDLIYLDWMGSYGPSEEKTLEAIFQRGWLSPRGILATTICAAGRTRAVHRRMLGISVEKYLHPQWLSAFYQDRVLEIATRFGWKASGKSYAEPYSCYDRGRKAMPMILSVLIGNGSFSAYQ